MIKTFRGNNNIQSNNLFKISSKTFQTNNTFFPSKKYKINNFLKKTKKEK